MKKTSFDAQLYIVKYLSDFFSSLGGELKGTKVSGLREVTGYPGFFVHVFTTGGSGVGSRILYESQITIDSYASTSWWAGELARTVSDAMHALPELPGPVALVRSPAPSELPDPDTDLRRYSSTYRITVRL